MVKTCNSGHGFEVTPICQCSKSNLLLIVLCTINFLPVSFMCTVPPQRNIIHLNVTSKALAGSETTVTCTSGSSNPVSSMVWRKGETVVTSGVMTQISKGDYRGEVLHSVFTFTALKFDNGVSVGCTPIWEGYEYALLKEYVYLNVLCKLYIQLIFIHI